ncbi:MAG: FHA domain-containing protein [Pirellulaceae bacterium]
MPLNAKLVVVGGEVKTAEIKLRLPSTVGRGRGASIMLPHPLVSRQHCELFEDGGRLMVRDLGSLNGTFVNNERISEAALPSGELLTVGAVTFRAVYDAHESNGPPLDAAAQHRPVRSSDTDPNGTVRSVPAQAAAPPEPVDEGSVEGDPDFNFDEPLTPVDENIRLPAPEHPKPAPVAPLSLPAQTTPQAKTTQLKPPTPAKQAASPEAKTEPQTVDFSKWDQEEEDIKPEGASDDDFNDFLKSLDAK